MSDNLKKKIPQDASRINVSQQHEINYWTKKFNCTPEKLKAAVAAVGTSAAAVEKHLNK